MESSLLEALLKSYLVDSMKNNKIISKSKYLAGLQCPKYLWFLFNRKESIPEPDAATQYIFDQGHLVGEYAKKLFPCGIDVEHEAGFEKGLRMSAQLLTKRKPLFEAGFLAGGIYARADILNPAGSDEWDIIEVKSSTGVKDINIEDVAFQRYCYEKAGLKIRKCYLTYINREYVRNGDINPERLFTTSDITEEAAEFSSGIRERIEEMFAVISSSDCPDIKIGRHCSKPYVCPLKDECWSFLPGNNVFDLYGAKNKAAELFGNGITLIKDIPEGYDLSFKQKIQLECEKTLKPRIDRKAIFSFLSKLVYPLYFLDFETFSEAIPCYDGTRPYQRIPFQFSLHVLDSMNGTGKHYPFLAEGRGDPRGDLLSSLKDKLGSRGSIIVYCESFEKGVLNELAESFSQYSKWVNSIIPRIVDLYEPFGKFYYYNSSQKGSASVKSVLPAITGISYDGLDISNGMNASISYLYITRSTGSSKTIAAPEEINKIRGSLEDYCKLDTEGLIYILRKLKKLTS